MNCPKCGSTDNMVKDSHRYDTYNRRRRICNDCGYKFTTKEIYKADYLRLKNGKK